VLYYSSDEYTGPADLSVKASDFIASRGLPYHINIAAHLHPMTSEQFAHIRRNGHEVSTYMWIWTDRKGSEITSERFPHAGRGAPHALRHLAGIGPGGQLSVARLGRFGAMRDARSAPRGCMWSFRAWRNRWKCRQEWCLAPIGLPATIASPNSSCGESG
jgi:hypothetical protein